MAICFTTLRRKMEQSSQAPTAHIAGASVVQKTQAPTKKKKPAIKGSKQTLSSVRVVFFLSDAYH